MRRQMLILSFVIPIVAFCSLSFADEPKFKNLKVLSKNTTKEELEIIMKEFKTALGVKCNHCHAQSKTDPSKLDFASDENEHKDIARGMMRMTARINKKFFKDSKDGGKEGGITCYGCHRGEEAPKAPPKEVLED